MSRTSSLMIDFFPRTPARQPNFTPPPMSQTLKNPAMEAAEAVMVSADMQRMAPLSPIDAAQTIVAPSAAINASSWLQKFFVNRMILDSDYCDGKFPIQPTTLYKPPAEQFWEDNNTQIIV